MTKLLSANLLRLRKNILFWALLAVSFMFGLFTVYAKLSDRMRYHEVIQIDSILFFYCMVIGLLSAVFVSLFFGAEYSDGAIRNKITVGHGRVQVYLVNLLTAYLVTLLATAAVLLAVLGLGLPTIGWFTLPIPALLLNFLGTLVMEAAFCALFTFVSMNCSKKAASAVVCVLLFFGLMVASAYVKGRLDAPEYISNYEFSIGGEIQPSEPEPNPAYLRGAEREAYEFVYDLLPTGQASQYTAFEVQNPVRLAVCSAVLAALFTAAGAALFRRKDLK